MGREAINSKEKKKGGENSFCDERPYPPNLEASAFCTGQLV